MKTITTLAIVLLAAIAAPVFAETVTVTVNQLSEKGVGKSIGTIRAEDSKDGLVLSTDLKGLTPGDHGFHVHENPSCDAKEKDGKKVAGLAAGGHYDPGKSGKHMGPKGKGHLGDLPALTASKDGSSKARLVAPRLKVADLKGRSLMIHDGSDNYSDDPKPLGGGGGRFACGVVK
jgi:superoxide dismutase, Cu-Zn family